MKKVLLLVVILVVVVMGCAKDPVSRAASTNAEVPVDLLFEHDGCRVYRFYDSGHPVYFVKQVGGPAQTTWAETHYNGKTSYTINKNVATEMATK